MSISELIDLASSNDKNAKSKVALAKLISIVERGGEGARQLGRAIFAKTGNAYVVGITGSPGSGKSTLTDKLITSARVDSRVCVLAIDPTSPFSGGAILGDRVRMNDHVDDDRVYIRSMATRGHLGGLSYSVPEVIRLVDAAGFGLIIVETVGVGQVEVEIAGAADTTVVVVNPGWGDSVQANKAGLMEIADIFVINKADRPNAKETMRDIQSMLDLGIRNDAWRPPIINTIATNGDGIDELYKSICQHGDFVRSTNELVERRNKRDQEDLIRVLKRSLEDIISQGWEDPLIAQLKKRCLDHELDPYSASEQIIKQLFSVPERKT